jgi:hypothetical protein
MNIPSFNDRRRRVGLRCGLLFAGALLGAACGGGGGGGSPTSPPMTDVSVVSGMTTTLASGGCTSDSHNFLVAPGGMIQVNLTASSDAAGLMVQICGGGIDNNDCTINLQPLPVGGTLSGVRRGVESQNLKFLRRGCTGNAPFVAGPATYTATATYLRP